MLRKRNHEGPCWTFSLTLAAIGAAALLTLAAIPTNGVGAEDELWGAIDTYRYVEKLTRRQAYGFGVSRNEPSMEEAVAQAEARCKKEEETIPPLNWFSRSIQCGINIAVFSTSLPHESHTKSDVRDRVSERYGWRCLGIAKDTTRKVRSDGMIYEWTYLRLYAGDSDKDFFETVAQYSDETPWILSCNDRMPGPGLGPAATEAVNKWPAAQEANPAWDWPRTLVFLIQAALVAREHDPGLLDGIMGPATMLALLEWSMENTFFPMFTFDGDFHFDLAVRHLLMSTLRTLARLNPGNEAEFWGPASEDVFAEWGVLDLSDPAPTSTASRKAYMRSAIDAYFNNKTEQAAAAREQKPADTGPKQDNAKQAGDSGSAARSATRSDAPPVGCSAQLDLFGEQSRDLEGAMDEYDRRTAGEFGLGGLGACGSVIVGYHAYSNHANLMGRCPEVDPTGEERARSKQIADQMADRADRLCAIGDWPKRLLSMEELLQRLRSLTPVDQWRR